MGARVDTSAPSVRGLAACQWYVRFLLDPVRCVLDLHRTFGPVCAIDHPFALGSRRRRVSIIALGPEFNRQVLGDPTRFRPTGQGLHGPRHTALGRIRWGLTRMTGWVHQKQRELLLPFFQRKPVESAQSTVIAATQRLVERWSIGTRVDMLEEMRRLTLEISSEVFFALADRDRSHALGEMIRGFVQRSFSLGVLLFPVDIVGSPYRGLLAHAERLEAEILSVVAAKRSAGAESASLGAALVRAHGRGRKWMTDTFLVGQMNILFGASYETTASALTWTLFLLAQHPAVMHDLLDEIAPCGNDALPTFDRLAAMPLLEAVIKESMRLLPPVPYTIRTATTASRVGGCDVQARDRVILSHYFTHRLSDLYPEPNRFKPQRWPGMTRSPYEFLPFSAGPRICIGASFAMMVIKSVLVMILPRFRLALVAGARIDRAVKVTLSPKHGMPMAIHAQDRRFAAVPYRGTVTEMVDPS